MKINFTGLGTLVVLFTLTACNNGSSTSTTDSTTISTDNAQTSSADVSASKNIKVHFDPSVSYVDLKTGKPLKLRVDTVTKYIVDETTNQPVMYYINPSTNDTFDRSGRLVNSALVRSSSGDYSVDESRITISTDDNSSMSSDDTTSSMSGAGGTATGNSKTIIKDDKFKQKTDSTKVKMKEGKVKIKTSAQ